MQTKEYKSFETYAVAAGGFDFMVLVVNKGGQVVLPQDKDFRPGLLDWWNVH